MKFKTLRSIVRFVMKFIADIEVHGADTVPGGNLIGAALPYELLDNPPADGDYVYFGISTADPSMSGPFSSLVFDIGTAAVYTAAATITWEYYNGGGWAALTTRDNTASDPSTTMDPPAREHA